MLDSVFRRLAAPELVKKRSDTAEASRLVVAKSSRVTRLPDGRRTCDLVYKGAYAYCVTNGVRHVYMVTSDVVLRHMLRTGLPCVALAAPVRMPDGVTAVAVKLDWPHLYRVPALASWYRSGWESRPTHCREIICPVHGPTAPCANAASR
jgi:N-acyl-L-homoserine lactone synthetase